MIIKNMKGEKIKVRSNKNSITIEYKKKKIKIPNGVDRLKFLEKYFEPNIYNIFDVEIKEIAYFNNLDDKKNEIIKKIKKYLDESISISLSCKTSTGDGILITFIYGCGDGVNVIRLTANPILTKQKMLDEIKFMNEQVKNNR